jgi:hypothetical protein
MVHVKRERPHERGALSAPVRFRITAFDLTRHRRTAIDGNFNSATEIVTVTLPTAGLADGRYLVCVVGRDA